MPDAAHHETQHHEVMRYLRRLDRKLNFLLNLGADEMADLTNITSAVERETTVTESAVTLLGELSDLIRQNASDPAALQALADQLDAEGQKLGDAVAANTPAA